MHNEASLRAPVSLQEGQRHISEKETPIPEKIISACTDGPIPTTEQSLDPMHAEADQPIRAQPAESAAADQALVLKETAIAATQFKSPAKAGPTTPVVYATPPALCSQAKAAPV